MRGWPTLSRGLNVVCRLDVLARKAVEHGHGRSRDLPLVGNTHLAAGEAKSADPMLEGECVGENSHL
jgi:hypothetical protein